MRSCWIPHAADCSRGIARSVFERVERVIECSFDGAFADEFVYRGVDRGNGFLLAPYTIARLIERRFVPTIYFGDFGGVLFSSPVSFNRPT